MEAERMIRIVNVLAVVFAVCMLLVTVLLYRRKEMSFRAALVWSAIFVSMAVATILFDQIQQFAEEVLLVQTIDLFVIAAIIILMTVSFVQYSEIRRNQKSIENIVHEMALGMARQAWKAPAPTQQQKKEKKEKKE